MTNLYQYSNAMKDFISYLNTNNYDAKKIVTSSIKDNLGYLLEYLSTHGIYCLVDSYTTIVYCDGTHEKARHYIQSTKSPLIIKEFNYKQPKPVIDNYINAIRYAFGFIEVPF